MAEAVVPQADESRADGRVSQEERRVVDGIQTIGDELRSTVDVVLERGVDGRPLSAVMAGRLTYSELVQAVLLAEAVVDLAEEGRVPFAGKLSVSGEKLGDAATHTVECLKWIAYCELHKSSALGFKSEIKGAAEIMDELSVDEIVRRYTVDAEYASQLFSQKKWFRLRRCFGKF